MNTVCLVGHLGKDAEVINTKSGTMMVKLIVATRSRVNLDNKPDWHTVMVKGKLAHTCVRCIKGMKVAVSGYLHTHTWEDEQGKKQYKTEVVAEEVEFHSSPGPKKEGEAESE